MSSILSLLPDILPMILPSAITVVKGTDLEAERQKSPDSPVMRQSAIIGKSDRMCATVMRAKPHCSSPVHHHGEQETMIYAASGKGVLVTNTGGDEDHLKRHELSAGDFALVPPWTEHQEVNETDEEVVWILIRSGPEPIVVNLTGWDGDRVKAG
ncbi:RmlC-like cupin domain-containing protein [Nemania sp. FL0916]|nr:RmlC-like cupin domain-containing protein [Nemania sp. FL0916]